jgi:RNA polymerase sigma factor (sigma-70 family)
MATGQLGGVLRHLCRATARREDADLSDGQLLGRFLADRDEASFAALVRRHGPLVWGTVRRVLRHEQDAEDAFQATFLVLARKAASVVPREKVAGWLHGVACNTARKARALAARRRGRERQVAQMPAVSVPPSEPEVDWLPLLDQELSGLPEKYRTALVLCDLAGKPRKEAARQLGVPEGTLSARLTRGRRLLAKRLARRGLALSGGALAAALAENAASASVPAPLAASTVTAAGGTAPAKVAALAEGVLKAMLLARLRQTGAALLLVAALTGTVGLPCWAWAAGAKAPAPPAGAPAAGARDRERGPAAKAPAGMAEEQRKRVLRWRIVFDTRDGEDYARQLEALGAVLAIPTGGGEYAAIRDFGKRPVKPVAEDLTRVRHVFWMESDPASVRALAKALGLKTAPEHVVVFLPKYVEDVLLRKELAHAGRKEENIEETTFRFVRAEAGYQLRVASQRARAE